MDKELDNYLKKIEKYLKPMVISERIDIVKEIKSEMSELQNNGASPEEIIERLGSPKELAKAYLGESISKNKSFSWQKLCAITAFYSLAGISGIFILPITSICGIAFMFCGILCPILGIIKFAAHFMGYEITQIQFQAGSYTAGAVAFLPISVVIGSLSFIIGKLGWDLTIFIIKSMSKIQKRI